MAKKQWMSEATPASHKGRLHKALGVPEGQKIPTAKVQAATHSKSPHVRKMAQLALRYRGQ